MFSFLCSTKLISAQIDNPQPTPAASSEFVSLSILWSVTLREIENEQVQKKSSGKFLPTLKSCTRLPTYSYSSS